MEAGPSGSAKYGSTGACWTPALRSKRLRLPCSATNPGAVGSVVKPLTALQSSSESRNSMNLVRLGWRTGQTRERNMWVCTKRNLSTQGEDSQDRTGITVRTQTSPKRGSHINVNRVQEQSTAMTTGGGNGLKRHPKEAGTVEGPHSFCQVDDYALFHNRTGRGGLQEHRGPPIDPKPLFQITAWDSNIWGQKVRSIYSSWEHPR